MRLNKPGPVPSAATSPSGAGESKPADVRIVRFREVHELCGLSRSTLWRKMRSREFPKSVKLLKAGGRRGPIGWYAHEIQRYLRERERS
jgi:predicted DNA-binding transcriptional regulator AlpA